MKIFYSWQSDIAPEENRYFIGDSLYEAKRRLEGIVNIEIINYKEKV